MRPLLVAALLAMGSEAFAQSPALPCTVPLGAPLHGGVEALAELGGARPVVVAVAGRTVVRSLDGGRTWVEAAFLEEDDEDEEAPCAPVVAASGRAVVVLDGEEALLGTDEGQELRRVGLPADAPVCAAALLDDGGLLVADDGGLGRLVLDGGVFREEERVDLEVDPERVAAGGGRVAVAGEGLLVLSEDGGHTFAPASRAFDATDLVDLAVDRSGDVWLWTSAGVEVLDASGGRRPVSPVRPASSRARIAVGDGRRALLLDGGALAELRPVCPRSAAPVEAPELEVSPLGRRAAVRGLLPSLVVTTSSSPGRQAIWVEVVVPLGRPASDAISGWPELAVEAADDLRARRSGARDAARRSVAGAPSLRAAWPPRGGLAELEIAVSALAARAELAIWAAP